MSASLPGRERSAFVEQPGAGGPAKRRALQDLPDVDQPRRFCVPVRLAIGRHRPLHVEGDAHLREHVRAVGDLVVDAEARADTVIERGLKRRHTLTKRVLRIGAGTDVHRRAGVLDVLPHGIRPSLTVVERVIGPKELLVPELFELFSCGVGLGGDSETEAAGQRPVLAVHAGEHPQRDELIG